MLFDRKTLLVAACLLTGAASAADAATEFHFSGRVSGGNHGGIDTPFANDDTFTAILTMDMDAAAFSSGTSSGSGTHAYAHYTNLSLEMIFGDLSFSYAFDPSNYITLTDGIQDQSGTYCSQYGCSPVFYDKRDGVTVSGNTDVEIEPGLTSTYLVFNVQALGTASANHAFWSDTGIGNLADFNTIATSGGQTGATGSLFFTNGQASGYINLNQILLTDVVDLSAVGAIPEPATWLMMIMGFGLTGLATARRRRMLPA